MLPLHAYMDRGLLAAAVFYGFIPLTIIVLGFIHRNYDRETKLLVERERAKAMLALRSGQVEDREKAFEEQKQAIREAAKKLRETKTQPAPTVPLATVAEVPAEPAPTELPHVTTAVFDAIDVPPPVPPVATQAPISEPEDDQSHLLGIVMPDEIDTVS